MDRERPRTEIDRFALAKLEAAGLAPASDASAETLLRRVSYGLTGLPPATADVAEFATAWRTSPGERERRYAERVDRLLASPQFGE